MKVRALLSALGALSPSAIILALRDARKARYLLSITVQHVDELRGRGLPLKHAIPELCAQRGIALASLRLPVPFLDDGGTQAQELVVLAGITAVIAPTRVFEIGTFLGLATTTFVLNAPPSTEVLTLDLPPDARSTRDYLPSDADLVAHRQVGEWYRAHGLTSQVTQLWVDSMQLDTSPYSDSVDLGFIDGAHSRAYVENDTRKMVEMMRPTGLILWHDYGGRGSFAGISDHLENLARKVSIYREPNTSLAWAVAGPLKALLR